MHKFTTTRWIGLHVLAVLLFYTNFTALAQQPGARLQAPVSPAKSAKVDAELTLLNNQYSQHQRQPNARPGPFSPDNPLLQLRPGNYVVIDAVAETSAAGLQKDLEALGATRTSVFGRVVSAHFPISRIQALESVASMRFVRPAYKPGNNAGFAQSQGDQAQRSDLARSTFGVNGKGVKVGILSDSYTADRAGVLSGDLPGIGNPQGFTDPVEILSDFFGGSDEGRAMAEIVHDVAPGAKMAFHTAFNGQADFAQGIIRLQEAGCDVIVDDVFYRQAPYFQDGIIAQAVDEVVRRGTTYFSSAGNNNRNSYEKPFQPSGRGYVVGEAHEFAGGDDFQQIFIPSGAIAIVVLQWSDPFFSVSGGRGAQTDLDLFLVNSELNQIVAQSAFSNIGNDPFEFLVFLNTGASQTFNLLIEKFEGPDPERLKMIGYDVTFLEHQTNSSTVFGHTNARGSIAVGAAFYALTPAFGIPVPVLQSFSAAGGTPVLFDTLGNRISPEIRKKPEIVAPDGANTTFFIPGIDVEGDGFHNFFGTSASAPHAAAAAALILEANRNQLKPDQIRNLLQETAIDMNDPFTPGFDEGFDFGTGFGFIQVDKALERSISAQAVRRFVLVNADNGQDIRELVDGDLLNLGALPTRNLNIVAITAPEVVGSVVFQFNETTVTENIVPYALGGDFVTDPPRFRPLNPPLRPGEYSLSAVPYTQARGGGNAGLSLQIRFRVVESAVTRFVLVNAATHQDLFDINDLDVIDLAELPTTQLNIRAVTNPEQVGSVVFEYNELRVVENIAPYALGGDFVTDPPRYRVLPDDLIQPGFYVLSATPYPERGGNGTPGGRKLVRLFFTDSAGLLDNPALAGGGFTNAPGNGGLSPGNSGLRPLPIESNALKVFPNPTNDRLTVQGAGTAKLLLFDATGKQVSARQIIQSKASTMDLSGLPAGLYLLRIDDGYAPRTVRVVKQ